MPRTSLITLCLAAVLLAACGATTESRVAGRADTAMMRFSAAPIVPLALTATAGPRF